MSKGDVEHCKKGYSTRNDGFTLFNNCKRVLLLCVEAFCCCGEEASRPVRVGVSVQGWCAHVQATTKATAEKQPLSTTLFRPISFLNPCILRPLHLCSSVHVVCQFCFYPSASFSTSCLLSQEAVVGAGELAASRCEEVACAPPPAYLLQLHLPAPIQKTPGIPAFTLLVHAWQPSAFLHHLMRSGT